MIALPGAADVVLRDNAILRLLLTVEVIILGADTRAVKAARRIQSGKEADWQIGSEQFPNPTRPLTWFVNAT
jgi:hypothetical protein